MKVSKFIGDLRKILKTTGDVEILIKDDSVGCGFNKYVYVYLDNFITDSDNRNIVRRNKGIEDGEIFLVIS